MPSGFESGISEAKARHCGGNGLLSLNGAPAGFEPAISTLKGWRPWPLDDGDSGKEYTRLFASAYIVDKLENHHKGASPFVVVGVRGGASSRRRGRRARKRRRGGLSGSRALASCIATALEGVGDEPVGELGGSWGAPVRAGTCR